ncbi:kinase-like domain-containing protein [Achaetomium macrosporum]|uniref:Kinase-like domain-containing protein n=1 Tax=Achaetomium macrosporum TaxID=79813 RepID=A0AAN7CGS7_9PEZI|nr:kinase-like domain-containing protein [Achaetomium macrosporum]
MSLDSSGSQSSQTQTIPLSDFLSAQEDSHFLWDDVDREMSEEWLDPVRKADLMAKKHKVFRGSKQCLSPPSPFVQLGVELGVSGSTAVYKVAVPDGYMYRLPLALKVIVCTESARPPGPDSKARSDALKEVKTMSELRHPHIVAYVASFEAFSLQTREIRNGGRARRDAGQAHQRVKKHILGIAMYPPAQCNLRTFMDEVFQNPNQTGWIVPQLHTYFGCLAQAVAYLHRQGVQIRHKDIKPENIVVDDFGQPILTDFGISKHFETGQYSEGPTPKTTKYAAPEAITEQSRDERSDIFSLGCVYLEMATVLLGKPPKFAEEQLARSAPFSPSGYGFPSRPFKYADGLPNLDAYLTTLTGLGHDLTASDPTRERSVNAVLPILPHIADMMNETRRRRPRAHQLYPWFRHLYDVYEQVGPCANCEEERRSGKAIPSPSPSRSGSPSLSRSGTVGSGVWGPSSSQQLQLQSPSQSQWQSQVARRGTAPSLAMSSSSSSSGFIAAAAHGGSSQGVQAFPGSSQGFPASSQVDGGEGSG